MCIVLLHYYYYYYCFSQLGHTISSTFFLKSNLSWCVLSKPDFTSSRRQRKKMLFRSESFDFICTIDLVKLTISSIPNLELYCRNKNCWQGPKPAGYRWQPAAISNLVYRDRTRKCGLKYYSGHKIVFSFPTSVSKSCLPILIILSSQ